MENKIHYLMRAAMEIEREACAKLAMDMPLKPEFESDDCKAIAFSISARIKMRSNPGIASKHGAEE